MLLGFMPLLGLSYVHILTRVIINHAATLKGIKTTSLRGRIEAVDGHVLQLAGDGSLLLDGDKTD
jgi:hypothetical protein